MPLPLVSQPPAFIPPVCSFLCSGCSSWGLWLTTTELQPNLSPSLPRNSFISSFNTQEAERGGSTDTVCPVPAMTISFSKPSRWPTGAGGRLDVCGPSCILPWHRTRVGRSSATGKKACLGEEEPGSQRGRSPHRCTLAFPQLPHLVSHPQANQSAFCLNWSNWFGHLQPGVP